MSSQESVPAVLPPVDGESVVVRTDFSDQARWAAAQTAMSTPSEPDGFLANVGFVDDPRFSGATVDEVLALVGEDSEYGCLFVADAATLTSDDWPIVCVGIRGAERGQTFRVVAGELWSVENNLSLANMDFYEFADNAGPDGVFRGL